MKDPVNAQTRIPYLLFCVSIALNERVVFNFGYSQLMQMFIVPGSSGMRAASLDESIFETDGDKSFP